MAMAKVTVRLDDRQIRSMFDRPTEARRYMERKVFETVVAARAEAPTKTTALQRSIGSTYRGGGRWEVAATAPHARFVHQGTEPHVIKARTKPRLIFFWKKVGRVVSLIQVNHPGTTPNPFLTRAMHKVWG